MSSISELPLGQSPITLGADILAKSRNSKKPGISKRLRGVTSKCRKFSLPLSCCWKKELGEHLTGRASSPTASRSYGVTRRKGALLRGEGVTMTDDIEQGGITSLSPILLPTQITVPSFQLTQNLGIPIPSPCPTQLLGSALSFSTLH